MAITIPKQPKSTYDDEGNYIYNAKFLSGRIARYNKIVASAGADSNNAASFRKREANVLDAYSKGKIDIDPAAYRDFVDYLRTFGFDENGNPTSAAELAYARLEYDFFELNQAGRQISEDKIEDVRAEIQKFRIRSPYSDGNQFILDRVAADVYHDMGIISDEDHAKSGEKETIEVLGKIPDLQGAQAIEFSERFIDRIAGNENLFNMAPPAALANAYEGTKERLKSGAGDKDVLQARLEKLAARIDELTDNFSSNSSYYFADQTNIADVYDGYNKMFAARSVDLDAEKDSAKIRRIEENKNNLEEFIKEYDERWGLSEVSESDAPKLAKKWDELTKRIGDAKVSEDTLKLAAKYKFLDENGRPVPQFFDGKGKESADYKHGYKLNSNGRLNRVIDLARHDIAMQNVAKKDAADDEFLEKELNDRIPFKLFEIDTADKVMRGALENPEQFTDPRYLEKFVADLGVNGGEISNTGYQAAMDAQVNQTGGWASRLKARLKSGSQKAGSFFSKVFNPIKDIDKRAEDRTAGSPPDKRKKRIEFFMRILKGFGSAFLVSAAITTIATAAAAVSGVGVAAAIAAIGVMTGIVMGAVQINKWRKAQQAAGRPADLTAFIKDKRLLATLGTTALASAAMIFGAIGLSHTAILMGYGAMALGGFNNAIAMYKDAKANGMSTKESLTWAIANAAAIVGGGFSGRMAANAGIQAFNERNPENTIFQNKETHTEIRQEQHTESRLVYSDDALHNAERIAKMWYQDNPVELQHRVDLINQYNADYGTDIDPYRAIILNADAGGHTFDNMAQHIDGGGVKYSGGQHTVLTSQWGAEHGFDKADLSALKNLFAADGSINPDGMDVAMRADNFVSARNEVGAVSSGDAPHYDGVLPQNTFDADGNPVYNTYADGDSVFHSETITVVNDIPVDITTYSPVDVPWGMGMFGIRFPKDDAAFQKLKDRAGAILDKIGEKEIPPLPKPKIEDEFKKLPPHKEPLPLPEGPKIAGYLPEHIESPDEMLAQEYDTFHGQGHWARLSTEQKKRYENMVLADLEQEPDPQQYKTLNDYIWHRLYEFDEKLRIIIDPLGRKSNKKKEFAVIAKTREDIWKSNADFNNMTLQDFQIAMSYSYANNHEKDVLRMSQDPKKGPVVHHRSDNRFSKGIVVLKDKIIQYGEKIREEKEKAKLQKKKLIEEMAKKGSSH
ncbi:MAG: hypothetical protein LBD50_01380 [Rickettsiales bacterium]|jgi:hypothetical protein|nr:hypothetical protein [Rickettsiales bacterium]